MSVNKVILLGNVGKDPEVRHLDGGSTVARFSLATSEKYTDKRSGEVVVSTEWHNVVCWRGLADVAEKYVKKGNQIYVEGKVTHRQYDTKEGEKRTAYEVEASIIQLLGNKPENNPAGNSGGDSATYQETINQSIPAREDTPASDNLPAANVEGDDLPF